VMFHHDPDRNDTELDVVRLKTTPISNIIASP
jgi:hypothetical protein